uniref:Heparanase n=1 Tax=Cynoglossus semilaevis TaxID=244447 RepID=A0A3P8UGV3_CYNSE
NTTPPGQWGLRFRGPTNDSLTESEPHSWAVDMDLSAVIHRVEPRFLSVTIDASLASEEKFMSLLRSSKLRFLAKALSPAFLRFGGTSQDFMVFTHQTSNQLEIFKYFSPSDHVSCDQLELPEWLERRLKRALSKQQMILMKEDVRRKYRRVKFTEYTVDVLHAFANCSGLDLIFGLNALLRNSDNTWNGSNARSLLRYCESRRYHMSWELGNEPNSYKKKAGLRVDGFQLGRDFTKLREMMSQSEFYHNSQLYGPDVGQPRDHRVDILQGFLRSGADAVDACTWHHYYVNGRDTSLQDFIDPEILDTLAVKTKEVLQKVKKASPGKSVWLGETSSAYGGGAPGLSDTFVAGFIYHLVDNNLDPLPDYWLSLLYKRLVGPEVLNISAWSASGQRVRLYLHCSNTNSYRNGAVTLMSLNLSRKTARISVPTLVSSSTVDAFVLQSDRPGEEGLYSRSVTLNGVVLKMVDDQTLPDLTGSGLPPADHLQLPAFSLAFFVFKDAQATACLDQVTLR